MKTAAPAPWSFCLFLCAMTAAVYWPVGRYPFVHFDDNFYVTQNPVVQRGLTRGGLHEVFTTPSPGGWPHPLALVSHMLDCQLYGLNAGGHHISNVLFHMAAAIFLFLALLEMTADPWRSSFVAAVFAVHPLQVESVAWVAERKNVLNGFFFMLTLWLYSRYARRPCASRYAGMMAAFVLSLLSKSVVVGLPVVLLLLDFWPLRRKDSWKRLILEKVPLLLLSGACAALALRLVASLSVPLPLTVRAGFALANAEGYLRMAVWPSALCVFYPFVREVPVWKIALGSALVIPATVFAIARARQKPWFFVGWLWFLAALVPYSGFVQLHEQAMCDHYMYLPLIGLALAAAWSVPDSVGEQVKILAGAGIVVALMIASGLQLRYWQDGATLFRRALMFHPESASVHVNLADAFYEQGALQDAVAEYRAGLALDPRHAEAHNNLAIAYIVLGQPSQAEKELLEELKEDPGNSKARHNLEVVRERLAKAKAAPPPPPRPSRRPRK